MNHIFLTLSSASGDSETSGAPGGSGMSWHSVQWTITELPPGAIFKAHFLHWTVGDGAESELYKTSGDNEPSPSPQGIWESSYKKLIRKNNHTLI